MLRDREAPMNLFDLVPALGRVVDPVLTPPRLLAGDRGVDTPAIERYATTHGIKQEVLPKPRAKSAKRMAHERP